MSPNGGDDLTVFALFIQSKRSLSCVFTLSSTVKVAKMNSGWLGSDYGSTLNNGMYTTVNRTKEPQADIFSMMSGFSQ